MKFYSFNPMVDQTGSVIHLMNPVNVTRISIAGIVNRVFKLKVRLYFFKKEKIFFSYEKNY